MFESDNNIVISNIIAKKSNDEEIFVDFVLGFFDKEKTKVYLELILKNDNRLDMALHQVNQSTRPEAILNYDETLSIVHCNDPFHKVFESNEELRHSHFKNDLINGFCQKFVII